MKIVLIGIGYALVGILFALPASNVQIWRLAAWAVCGVGYTAHIGYERFRLGNRPVIGALHVAVGVAIGGLGLAIGANIHSIAAGATPRPLLLLSLAIWPVMTALPAFLVALVISIVLARESPRRASGR